MKGTASLWCHKEGNGQCYGSEPRCCEMSSLLHEPSLPSMCWEPLYEDTAELVSVQSGCKAGLNATAAQADAQENHGGALSSMRG